MLCQFLKTDKPFFAAFQFSFIYVSASINSGLIVSSFFHNSKSSKSSITFEGQKRRPDATLLCSMIETCATVEPVLPGFRASRPTGHPYCIVFVVYPSIQRPPAGMTSPISHVPEPRYLQQYLSEQRRDRLRILTVRMIDRRPHEVVKATFLCSPSSDSGRMRLFCLI